MTEETIQHLEEDMIDLMARIEQEFPAYYRNLDEERQLPDALDSGEITASELRYFLQMLMTQNQRLRQIQYKKSKAA